MGWDINKISNDKLRRQLREGIVPKPKGKPSEPTPKLRQGDLGDGKWIVLPYPPTVNRYLGFSIKNKRFFKSKEGRDFDLAVQRVFAGLPFKPLEGPISFTMRLYRPRKAGDLNNYSKQLADCLQGFLYVDDAQITEFHAYRFDDKDNPRVEVMVRPI